MDSIKATNRISFAYFKYQIKILTFKVLKSIHNLLFAIGIDIRLRKSEKAFDAVAHNSLDGINKFYSSEEVQFAIISGGHQKFYHKIIDVIDRQGINLRDKHIADFGCEIGNLLFHLNGHFNPASCFGFDFSEKLVELAARRFPEGEFITHDIYIDLNRKFDFVFCTEVIEHLLYPGKALNNILESVNKKGGGAFISVPDGRKDTFAGHINFWSPESWEVFIKSNTGAIAKVETGYVTPEILYALVLFENN